MSRKMSRNIALFLPPPPASPARRTAAKPRIVVARLRCGAAPARMGAAARGALGAFVVMAIGLRKRGSPRNSARRPNAAAKRTLRGDRRPPHAKYALQQGYIMRLLHPREERGAAAHRRRDSAVRADLPVCAICARPVSQVADSRSITARQHLARKEAAAPPIPAPGRITCGTCLGGRNAPGTHRVVLDSAWSLAMTRAAHRAAHRRRRTRSDGAVATNVETASASDRRVRCHRIGSMVVGG